MTLPRPKKTEIYDSRIIKSLVSKKDLMTDLSQSNQNLLQDLHLNKRDRNKSESPDWKQKTNLKLQNSKQMQYLPKTTTRKMQQTIHP